jgi:hypothetical protein
VPLPALLVAITQPERSLQVVPIDPVYYYPESLPMDAPKRLESLPPFAWFLLALFFTVALPLAVWDTSVVAFASFVALLAPAIAAVSAASLACSAVHAVVGVPRPDSIAQCATANVSALHCGRVLSHRQAVDQFRSFPAIEAALSVSSAVTFSWVAEVLAGARGAALVCFMGVPVAASVAIVAFFLATGAYRAVDLVAGAAIGALMASLARPGTMVRPAKTELEGTSEIVIRRDLWQD